MFNSLRTGMLLAALTALFMGVGFILGGGPGMVIAFLFATAPVASHLIARAAFVAGTPLWERTSRDDQSDPETNPDAQADTQPEPAE